MALNSPKVQLPYNMSSLPLTNYLRSHRKRLALTQEEVAFLLGVRGSERGIKVCRDERLVRDPSLATALAYEVIYGRPVRELFAGMYSQIEQEVLSKAKLLVLRKDRTTGKKASYRREILTKLANRKSEKSIIASQP
jgi:transcriptional regulator with XRE-family HTH domain